MLFPWLTIFDFNTFRSNFKKPTDFAITKSSDFAILLPIFNDIKYLKNTDFLKQYGEKVVLCTTSNETEDFYNNLNKLASEHKFRITYSDIKGSNKKNPWLIYNKTLLAHEAVLKESIRHIKESYVIFIDGDTTVEGDLEILCGTIMENNFDIASVKVLPSRRKTLIEKLQGVEYDIAMQSRLNYPWLTSGAGMIAKRQVMEKIMQNHSLFFNGGDIEIGKISQIMGYKAGHIPMVFLTEVPETITGWIKQRFSWMCGCFRHSIINIDKNLRYPFHFIYFSFIVYFLLPIKVFHMINHWHLLPIIIIIYALITYFANWKVRSKWMFIFPFYALFQITILIWFGLYRYIETVLTTKNIGRIKIRNNPNNIKFLSLDSIKKWSYNYSVIGITIFTILITTSFTLQKVAFGKTYEPLELLAASKDYIGNSKQIKTVRFWVDANEEIKNDNIVKIFESEYKTKTSIYQDDKFSKAMFGNSQIKFTDELNFFEMSKNNNNSNGIVAGVEIEKSKLQIFLKNMSIYFGAK